MALRNAIGDAQARQLEAQKRARELLRACLTPAQVASMDNHGFFRVAGSHGGVYDINVTMGITGNVVQREGTDLRPAGMGARIQMIFEAGRIFPVRPAAFYLPRSWCIYLPGAPAADTWLAQKLLIETDEPGFQLVAIS